MWEELLLSNKLDVHMDRTNLLLQLTLHNKEEDASTSAPPKVQLSHAELVQLLHTVLEANRCFRGDIAYFQN